MEKNSSVDQKQIVWRSLIFVAVAYTFCVIFDPFFYDYSLRVLPLRQLYGCMLAAGVLYACVRLKYVGVALYFCLCLFSACWFYAYKEFGYSVGFEFASAMLETNKAEIAGFINGRFLIVCLGYLVFAPLLYGMSVFCLGWSKMTRRSMLRVCVVACAWVVIYEVPPMTIGVRHGLYMKLCDETMRKDKELLMGAGMVHAHIVYNRWRLPYSNFKALYNGISEYYRDVKIVYAENFSSVDTRPEEPLLCVCVIGESVRGDHVPAGGYARNTMPICTAEKNVCFYSKMYSFAPVTYHSVKGIMAGLINERSAEIRTSFASILKKHGFVNSWYAENTEKITNSRLMSSAFGYSMDENKVYRMPVRDVATAILKDAETRGKERQLIIVENGTGHFPYMTEDKYARFYPCNTPSEGAIDGDPSEIMMNAYDNCIVAVDAFLGELIEGMRQKNALLFYVSDHGELLGERGRFMHGAPEDEPARHVASFIWFSDEYERRHPELVADMKSVKDKLLVHGQIYATILRLCGIKSDVPLDIGDFVNGDVREVEHNLPKSMNIPSRVVEN